MAVEPTQDSAETTGKPRSAKYWHDRLAEYKSAIEEKWGKRRENIDKLYSKDERADSADREYSIFWANIEVLKEAAYARTPVPVVDPRFKVPNKVASTASDAVERCLITGFEQSDLDGCMREVRDEFLMYSRGTARVRLEMLNGVSKLAFDHFTACDFAHDPARNWREVKWVGFRAWLTQDEGAKRFDEALKPFGFTFADVPKKKRDPNAVATDKTEDKVPVWEIWCRTTGKVHFVAEDFDTELDTQDPWLDLTTFWPCPRPVFGTTVPGKLKPVPDIVQYKDQIEEINEYTARISALSESLRMKGFYPAGASEVSDAIEAAIKSLDNRATLVPISSYAALGGASFKDSIVWLPVVDALQLITGLVELRRVVIDDVYQITGISDIVRGQSDPNETLGAQQLKTQWGSLRIRGRQNEMARFARDMTRIGAEIIAENFEPETIMAMSQLNLPKQQDKAMAQMKIKQVQAQVQEQAQMAQAQGQPAPPMPEMPPEMQTMLETPSIEEVIAFLRDDKARGFVIEVETDSTIQPDEDADKQRRVEFATAIGTLFKEAAPMVMQAPQMAPFLGEVLKFTAQGFRAGRPLEGAIDDLVEQMNAMAKQANQPPPPDPKVEAEKAKAETAKVQSEAKLKETEAKTAATMAELQAKMQAMNDQRVMERQAQEAELQFLYDKLGIEREGMRMKAEASERQAQLSMETAEHKAKQAKETEDVD